MDLGQIVLVRDAVHPLAVTHASGQAPNGLIIRSLINMYAYYGDDFTVECPTGSGKRMNLYQVSEELTRRLGSIFTQDEHGRRPVYGGMEKFQSDPHWRDNILFHEYFHGDNGAGLGASHHTGWTGLIAPLMKIFGAPERIADLMRPPGEDVKVPVSERVKPAEKVKSTEKEKKAEKEKPAVRAKSR